VFQFRSSHEKSTGKIRAFRRKFVAEDGDGPQRLHWKEPDPSQFPKPPIPDQERETMRSHSLWVSGIVAGLALAGCATHRPASESRYDDASVISKPRLDAELMSYRIRNWSAPNDHTLILEGADGQQYRAETLGPCFGLAYANRVGFANRGGFQAIDRFSSVVLPDGTRCAFQNFSKVVSPATQALDSFERLGAKDSGNGSSSR
jgi:hypothetical protein